MHVGDVQERQIAERRDVVELARCLRLRKPGAQRAARRSELLQESGSGPRVHGAGQ